MELEHARQEVLQGSCTEESPSREAFENDFISVVLSEAQQQQHLLSEDTELLMAAYTRKRSHSFGVHFGSAFWTECACNQVRPEGTCRLSGKGSPATGLWGPKRQR